MKKPNRQAVSRSNQSQLPLKVKGLYTGLGGSSSSLGQGQCFVPTVSFTVCQCLASHSVVP